MSLFSCGSGHRRERSARQVHPRLGLSLPDEEFIVNNFQQKGPLSLLEVVEFGRSKSDDPTVTNRS
jgi:hypothetical protein